MNRIFAGYDRRESVGWHVFAQSVIDYCGAGVSITSLAGDQRDGSNAFTYSRFLVPELCGFKGLAVFVDGADMLVRADVSELFRLWDGFSAVMVVKHDYKTKHPRKYLGTSMESENRDYPRKNWSSVILWDCGHPLNWRMKSEYVKEQSGADLHRFAWLTDDRIGSLPVEWNWLVDEYGENEQAKLLHWTAGIPGFRQYRESPHAKEWLAAAEMARRGMQC